MYSEAGPVAPAGGGVGGTWGRARAADMTTLRARSVTLQVPSLSYPPLSSQTAVQTSKPQKTSKLMILLVKRRSVTEKCLKGLP